MYNQFLKITRIFITSSFFAIILFTSIFQTGYAKSIRPAVWGKVLKAKNLHGHSYFIFFKTNGNSYAYPLSTSSSVNKKKLAAMVGKYVRIYGKEKIERISLEGTSHILTFEVSDISELTLADLNQNFHLYQNRIDTERITQAHLKSDQFIKEGISDKVVNSAIFIGGTILATEVLGVLLTQ